MPGFSNWGKALDDLLAEALPLWVSGGAGCGISYVGSELARRRGVPFLDDADLLSTQEVASFLKAHPRGILIGHKVPAEGWNGLLLRLPFPDEDPPGFLRCLERMAGEVGISGELPAALRQLPCPGGFRGLHNRLLRFKYLGQLPGSAEGISEDLLPLDSDDMATNLHVLERLLLHRALRRSYGNRVEAAQRLGVSRRQLYLLIERHGDPVRGEAPRSEGPKRLDRARTRQKL